jgi:hypothetical protein
MFGQNKHLEKKLRERGKSTNAQILVVHATDMAITHGNDSIVSNTEIVVKLTVRIAPPGESSWDIETTTRMPQLEPYAVGESVLVWYDPADHSSVLVDREANDAAKQAKRDAVHQRFLDANAAYDKAMGHNADGTTSAPTVSPITIAQILATGLPTRVVIVQTMPVNMKNPQGLDMYALVLTVMHDGQLPTRAQVGNPVPAACVGLLYPGSNLPARVLADNPGAIAIDWDAAIAEFTPPATV